MTRTDLAQKRADLKAQIREAAILEFAEHGLAGTSTQGIADRAGITKNKLHYHIESKEELYQQALHHIIRIWEELFDSVDLDSSPEAFLSDYIRRKIRFSLDHPAEVKMFTGEVMRGAPLLRESWAGSREASRAAAERIRQWAEAGLIRPVNPMLLQFNIWAMTEAYAILGPELRFMLDMEDGEALDQEAICAEMTALVLQGLRPANA
ncbi:TetR family transcriptional regulator C-terminal domain-containing protein [Falsirhodobacter sp. alg1]|uniref:TetR family transcriptional regulator C-terminal domain-containing protein n=1 Tax=Falsirhodobacter sp. alg1 TaxID=1472418 RepID=UPI0005EDE310|nr:TetR family transcriptional regulator C-terminal domain-containing protein [Falsirhodobacter sp. alg1]